MTDKQTIIYLIRHGESEFNLAKRVSGHSDPALTRKGEQQALEAKQEIGQIEFHEVYSSDLKRAIRTAEIVSDKSIHSDNKLPSLREKYFGSLETLPEKELEVDREMRLKLPKSESWAYKHVADMESDEEVVVRLISQIKKLAEKHLGQTILIGSHGTAIRVILMRLQDKHYNEMPEQRFRNGGHVKLIYQDDTLLIDKINGYN